MLTKNIILLNNDTNNATKDKNFFVMLLSIILLTHVSIYLDVPIIRQITGFIYLSYIPGVLIIRVLKLYNKINIVEKLLYSVGFSVSFLMFIGFILNILHYSIDVLKPLSTIYILLALDGALFVLFLLNYHQRNMEIKYIKHLKNDTDGNIDKDKISLSAFLFLCLIPIISALGASISYYFNENKLLILLIIIISGIVLVYTFSPTQKFSRIYPFTILTIAISLLFHKSLISPYLWGWDIFIEHYLFLLVKTNLYWDTNLPYTVNAMLSVTILPTIYSNILNLDGIQIFKIVYPLLFSLVPVGLYQIYQRQFGDKIAFLASFYFMSFFTFYDEMLSLARQEIAELFYVLLILTLINEKITHTTKWLILIILSFSLIISHYGISYIFIGLLLISYVLSLFLTKYIKIRRFLSRFSLVFIPITLSWFMFISSGIIYKAGVNVLIKVYVGAINAFFSPELRDPNVLRVIGVDILTVPLINKIGRVIHYITEFFILVGVIEVIMNHKKFKLIPEFKMMMIASMGIVIASIILPYLAGSLNMTRIFHVALFFLAPACIIGGIATFRLIFLKITKIKNRNDTIRILSTLLVMYLLYNTGFIHEIIGYRSSLAFDPNDYQVVFTHTQDFISAQWLLAHTNTKSIYGDYYTRLFLIAYGFINKEDTRHLTNSTIPIENIPIFLRYGNILGNEIYYKSWWESPLGIWKHVSLDNVVFPRYANKVYDNGAQVWLR